MQVVKVEVVEEVKVVVVMVATEVQLEKPNELHGKHLLYGTAHVLQI